MLSGNYAGLIERSNKLFQMHFQNAGDVFLRWYYGLGLVYYERNELDTAIHYWAQLMSLKYRTSHFTYFHGLLGLALANQALGLTHDADYFTDMALTFAQEAKQHELYVEAKSFQARLSLLRGHEAVTAYSPEEVNPAPYDFFKISVEVPVITRLWMLITQKTKTSLSRANQLLHTSLEITQSRYNIPITIKLLTLQALLYAAQKKPLEAESSLIHAVELAKPRGFMRTFIDFGPKIKELLSGSLFPRKPFAVMPPTFTGN